MTNIRQVKEQIEIDPGNGIIYLMDFVDDFRYYKNTAALSEPYKLSGNSWDALLASTAEYLCDEMHLEAPEWVRKVPSCNTPWFLSGLENLKAIALAESPLHFRIRKIFVLENFLSRA